ncbi:hypothetical protein [Emticicia agri]|uniref:Uncharacterized protein n=1 Tax=Emticicia agri TaxID=2492393 RepID=A0A4Q5LTL8_9BACT|nr:hypothetical protein [Emticicia agri]RYU92976.1 hypothetical protein EWM59_24355 [Emticicia agri]
MLFEEIIGKKITNIYCLYGQTQGWLDTAECFIELDKQWVSHIPWFYSDSVELETVEVKKGAVSIFKDLADYPVYHVNKANQSIGEIAENHRRRQSRFFNKWVKVLFGYEFPVKEYVPYQVEYVENKLKYLKDSRIVDFIWFEESDDKGFFLLDNGYLITETTMSPSGTGLAGLNYYQTIDAVIEERGHNFEKLTDRLANK